MIKRCFDIIASVCALVLLSIPLSLIAALVLMSLGRPIFFWQKRIGLNGKAFNIIKFRTMLDTTDVAGNLLPDDVRLTTVGLVLRSTSVDELPELLNIIKGDMSFVGPRPLLPDYLPYYLPEQMRRHEVRPGLTGLAQITGRNKQSWGDRFRLDVEYVDTRTFRGDLLILLKTVLRVVRRQGVSAEGHQTMPRFDEQVRGGLAKGQMTKDAQR